MDTKLSWLLAPLILISACGPQGPRGIPGKDGESIIGPKGDPGQGCTVKAILAGDPVLPLGGALITCDSTYTLVSNGADGLKGDTGAAGIDGRDGVDAAPSAYAVTEVLNPCGANSTYDEVLLKLANGKVLASFSQSASGNNTRLSLLVPNTSYVTTDTDLCYFKIDASGNLTNEHH